MTGGPNRACAFDTSPHTELACNYEEAQCGLSYLGVATTSPEGDLLWIPHFSMEHNFYEPTFWRLGSCMATREGLTELAKVFGGEISWDDFFALYPPANRVLARAVLPDAEGFVVYLKMTAFGKDGQYVYCKAKTWMYYILHKIRPNNIPAILRMPQKFGEAFPGYRSVREFFGEGERRTAALIEDLSTFVMSEEMRADIPWKALNALQHASPDVAFKIVLNNSQRVWKEGSVRVAANHFSVFAHLASSSVLSSASNDTIADDGDMTDSDRDNSLSDKREKAGMLLRQILMTVKCFDDGWRERLAFQFDVENITRGGRIPELADALWGFIHNS